MPMGLVLQGAPSHQRQYVGQYDITQESLRVLTKRHGIKQKTFAKWNKLKAVKDLSPGLDTGGARLNVGFCQELPFDMPHANVGNVPKLGIDRKWRQLTRYCVHL
jgi:hypothetical protein